MPGHFQHIWLEYFHTDIVKLGPETERGQKDMRRQTVISWSSSSVVTGLKEMRLCLSSGIKSDIRESFLEGKFAGS